MNVLFQRILNGYLGRSEFTPITGSELNLLPYVFLVSDFNSLDLSSDNSGIPIQLPARAGARNMTLAERMRSYSSYRVTK
jgi:hypothetical protein